MKAAVNESYGPPNVVHIKEIAKPVPQENEVLIKLKAGTVTSGDARIRALNVPFGFKIISRLVFGITKPRKKVLGVEYAGVIEAVGKSVTAFQVGDEVFGGNEKMGCHTEYITMPENAVIVKKPAAISFEEAAAIPFGALSSLTFLRDFGKLKQGEKILINGASGSLGCYAIQLAKYYGAEVTGICSTSNVALVKSLGADHVIDYTQEQIETRGEIYDVVYDTVGKLSFSQCKQVLKPGGRCLFAVAGLSDYWRVLWTAITGGKKLLTGVSIFKRDNLEFIVELIQQGKLRAVIDKRYPLTSIADAHRHVDSGRKKGNVVIKMT